MAVKHTAEVTVYDVTDAYSVTLTNEAASFKATATDKLGTAATATTKPQAFMGTDAVSCSVAAADCVCSDSTNVSVSVNSSGDNATWPLITITIGANTTASGTVTIPVVIGSGDTAVTIEKVFSYSIALKGAGGSAAYNYFLSASPSAIVRAENGTLSTSSVAWSATRATTGNPSAYSGYVWSHYTTDGSTWTQIAKASSAASSGTVTVPSAAASTVSAVRITLHTASPTDANKVDSVTVPVIDAGATGPQGDAAYTVLLTNESHTFAAAADGKAVASSIETKVVAYKGSTQVSATIGTVTGTISGKLTATVKSGTNGTANATLTVAATATLDTRQGVLVVPITVDGKTFTKNFSWTLAPKGDQGIQGIQGEPGDDPYTLSITGGNVLKNNTGSVTLTCHVFQAGAELDTMPTGCSVKWYVDGTLAETDSSLPSTFTRTAAQVTNLCVVCAKLEG